MSPRTIFLSKLIGLYCLILGLAMLVHRHATMETFQAIVQTAPVLYVAGIIALAMGLAMVLGHNIWKGGVLPVVVTLVGWLSLLKGLTILFLPRQGLIGLATGAQHGVPFLVKAAVAGILGIYLTIAGFTAKAQ